MRRALPSNRLRPFAQVKQPSLGAGSPRISLATYTRQRWATPQTCPLYARPSPRRFQHTKGGEASKAGIQTGRPILRRLPLQCTGCGAFAQTTDAAQAGFFNLERRAVQEHLGLVEPKTPTVDKAAEEEDRVVEEALSNLPPEQLEALGLTKDALISDKDVKAPQPKEPLERPPPVCERCQNLTHHHKAEPIFHPSVHSIAEIIHESPHKHNHVYHLVDAADFPMSLIPRLHTLLGDINLRSQNRRSRKGKYYGDQKFDMSFIITRSDLLAPKEEQVNSLMPYLREVLRDALGRVGRRIRLGNVRCVSANRGWWTTELKKDIYERGGAGWMVGKANVGKSKLFDSVFPKGRMGTDDLKKSSSAQSPGHGLNAPQQGSSVPEGEGYSPTTSIIESPANLDIGEWLPPARNETDYPAMPTVSALPGTTASPIRIPFGKGKGELIDLPGLARSDLEEYVQPEHRQSLIMSRRIKPEMEAIKPGQSLLLGGFIRITPRTPDLIFLAASFTPLKTHLTSTDKATSIQNQEGTLSVENISVHGTGEKIQCAGSIELAHDVTKESAGPLTRNDALRMKPTALPFRVLAVDILIESVGWVELRVQVRTRDYPHESPETLENNLAREEEEGKDDKPARGQEEESDDGDDPWAALQRAADGVAKGAGNTQAPETQAPEQWLRPVWPVVDVFTPEGRFVGSRRPLCGYEINKTKAKPVKRMRKSMKGAKKREKMAKRAARAEARA